MKVNREKAVKAFVNLLDIMDELRQKCPWDSVQTFDSLRNLTTEEVFELSDAVFEKDMPNIKKELGDILLHIVFYSKLGEEGKSFDISDVIESLNQKLIFRHPHIFGNVKVNSAKDVEENWEKLKLKEKDGNKTVLSGIPKSLPACIKAYRIQEKVKSFAGEWERKEYMWEKLKEEIDEFSVELENKNQQKMEEEFGDILFSLINTARQYHIHAEDALEKTNRKMIKRFTYFESQTIGKGLKLEEMTKEEKEKIWEESKKI